MDELARLRDAFKAGREAMLTAISADFGHRSAHETLLSDAMTVSAVIDHLRGQLRGWLKPRRVGRAWRLWPARAQGRHVPVRRGGVMWSWKYPGHHTLPPPATAIPPGHNR